MFIWRVKSVGKYNGDSSVIWSLFHFLFVVSELIVCVCLMFE